MREFSLEQVATLLHINVATLYRWLKRANMEPRQDEHDKRRRYLSDEQVKTLRRLHQHAPIAMQKDSTTLADALQTIQQQLDSMQDDIHALERALHALQTPQPTQVPQPPTPRTTARISAPDGSEEELPDGYIEYRGFWQLHGIPESTAGRFTHILTGKWKRASDGHIIEKAIDQPGRAAFYERFKDHKSFTRCLVCPHDEAGFEEL